MPVDPEIQKILDTIVALGVPLFEQMTPEEARVRPAMSQPKPEPVARVADRELPGPDGPIPVRVYTPQEGSALPCVVFFHGGGWVIGNLDSHDDACRTMANRAEAVVASVDYRLAPENKFPAAIDDAYATTAYVAAHPAEFGVDPARIAVAGDSAGGNLAAAVTLMSRDRGGPAITTQVLVYPVMDNAFETPSYHENAEGYLLTRAGMQWFSSHYLRDADDAANPYASPIRAPDLSGLPPAHIITAEYDPLRDEGEQYAERLRAAGVPAVTHRYDGMIHGFFQMSQIIPQGLQAIYECADVLKRALHTEVGSSA